MVVPLSFNTLLQSLSQGPPAQTWATASATVSDDGADITQAIHQGLAMVVSNGSFKEGFGMAAFTIVGNVSSHQLVATNVTPSQRDDINSYHSELRGLYGVMAMVKQVVSYHDINNGQIEVGSNCLVGLQRVFMDWQKSLPLEAHHDLVLAIHRKVCQSPLQWR